MPVIEKTVFISSDGRQFDIREDAERADTQTYIADAVRDLVRDDEDKELITPALADNIAWFSTELLAILKKHLEPDGKRFDPIEAPIDEARAIFEFQRLFRDQPTVLSVGNAIARLMTNRREVVMILQGIERPEPISAQEATFKIAAIQKSADLGDRAIQLVDRRAEVIAILQAVRP